MPSNDSSRTEHPGDITSDLPNRCDSCGHHRREHTLADGACGCGPCVGFVGPPDSASSTPNDVCQCGHTRLDHQESTGMLGGQCDACYIESRKRPGKNWRHAFAPAEPEAECQHRDAYQITGDRLGRPGRRMGYVCETCGEVWMKTAPKAPECSACGGNDPKGCPFCKGAADELSQQTQDMEPEARECDHPDGCQFKGAGCVNMCAYEGMFGPKTPAPAPRRPPYAVAYAIEGGAQYEIALPGDASVRAVDGALVITHDSAVLALSHVRPMEGQ